MTVELLEQPFNPASFVAAFAAADYLMDRRKTEAVFWKREEASGGGRRIEPTVADLRDHARWTHDTGDSKCLA